VGETSAPVGAIVDKLAAFVHAEDLRVRSP